MQVDARRLVIISVKSGNTGPHHVRELHGALAQTSSAAIGVLVILEPRTKAMIEAAAKAGFYKSAFGDYPKIQIITVEEMLNGIQIGMPPPASIENVTFPSIEKVNGVVQPEFLF